MIVWNERFKTGSDQIDRQHQMLIDNINHLELMLTDTNPTKEECEFLIQLVTFLENYTKDHFKFEEDCMERYRCSVHARNKLAHEEFLKFFEQFRGSYHHHGFRPDIIRTLHETISTWIQEHILRVDMQLKPCLKAD